MDIETALVARLNAFPVSSKQIYGVIDSFLKGGGGRKPLQVATEAGFSAFVKIWLDQTYKKYEPFLCDALTSRARALIMIVKEVAFVRNQAAPDLSTLWKNPAFLLTAGLAPFQSDEAWLDPLFDRIEFFIHLDRIQNILARLEHPGA